MDLDRRERREELGKVKIEETDILCERGKIYFQ